MTDGTTDVVAGSDETRDTSGSDVPVTGGTVAGAAGAVEPPVAAGPRSRRTLWIGLGVVSVIAALAAAGFGALAVMTTMRHDADVDAFRRVRQKQVSAIARVADVERRTMALSAMTAREASEVAAIASGTLEAIQAARGDLDGARAATAGISDDAVATGLRKALDQDSAALDALAEIVDTLVAKSAFLVTGGRIDRLVAQGGKALDSATKAGNAHRYADSLRASKVAKARFAAATRSMRTVSAMPGAVGLSKAKRYLALSVQQAAYAIRLGNIGRGNVSAYNSLVGKYNAGIKKGRPLEKDRHVADGVHWSEAAYTDALISYRGLLASADEGFAAAGRLLDGPSK
jgi:hypothetical protein